MFASLNDRFVHVGAHHPNANSRVVFCRPNANSMRITVVNEYACNGPPPSVCQQQARLRRPIVSSNARGSTSNSHGNMIGLSEANKKSSQNRAMGRRFSPHNCNYQNESVPHPRGFRDSTPGSNLRMYMSTRGPVTDLREILKSRPHRSSNRGFRTRGSFRNFNVDLRPNAHNQNGAISSGYRNPPPSIRDAHFEQHGYSELMHCPSGSRPAKTRPSGSHRGRGHYYWQHDDRPDLHRSPGLRFPQRSSALLDAHVGDEYIDDFSPEDLAQLKLEINMDSFTVQYPLLSNPILSVPLSQWNSDDLHYSPTFPQTIPTRLNTHPPRRRGTRYQSSPRPYSGRILPRQPARCEQPRTAREATSNWVVANSPKLQETPVTEETSAYLKPAFQLWSDSGLGTAPRQRHTSEIIHRPNARLSPFELYQCNTWPCLHIASSSTGTLIEFGVVESMSEAATQLRCRSLSCARTRSPKVSGRRYHSTEDLRTCNVQAPSDCQS